MQVLLQNWVLNLQPNWIGTPEKTVIFTYWANSPETLICKFFYDFRQERMIDIFSLKYPLFFCPTSFLYYLYEVYYLIKLPVQTPNFQNGKLSNSYLTTLYHCLLKNDVLIKMLFTSTGTSLCSLTCKMVCKYFNL